MCDVVCLACCGACAFAIFLAFAYFGFGVIFIVLASRAKSSVSSHQALTTQDLSLFPNLCIAIGVLFTLLTLLGLAGEKKGRKTRIVYAVAQVVVVFLGLYIYLGTYPEEKNVGKHLLEGMNNTIGKYGEEVAAGSKKNYTAAWDNLQENWECCGAKNYLDWEIVHLPLSIGSVPVSCCRAEHRMTGCSKFVPFDNPYEANKYIYAQGCMEPVISEILGRMKILHYFLVPILIVTSLGVLVSSGSSGVRKDSMEEKKLGPLIVRRNTKKSKDTPIEDTEKGDNQENDGEEKEKLNSETERETAK